MVNTIVFNNAAEQQVVIDDISYVMPAGAILPLVANQHFVFEAPENLTAWQFNRDFYCIADHDVEVGCVGFIFYGIQHPLFVLLSPAEIESIILIQRLCIEDMTIKDKMQGKILRTFLKRLIIKNTGVNFSEFNVQKAR